MPADQRTLFDMAVEEAHAGNFDAVIPLLEKWKVIKPASEQTPAEQSAEIAAVAEIMTLLSRGVVTGSKKLGL